MKAIKTLAPWFGSNRTLAAQAGAMLDGCSWVGVPFGGGMSEVAHVKARSIVVNDLHRHIINLARVAAHPVLGPRLYRALRRQVFHPDTLRDAQKQSLEVPQWDIADLPAAFAYFIAVWMGRSAKAGTPDELRGNLSARWTDSGGDSNRRYRSAVEALRDWRRVFVNCNFTTLDCFEFLSKCRDAKGVGIYCDPPFHDAGDTYRHDFTERQHERLALELSQFSQARVVCRFHDHPLIRRLYPETHWHWNRLEGRDQANGETPELLLLREGQLTPAPRGGIIPVVQTLSTTKDT